MRETRVLNLPNIPNKKCAISMTFELLLSFLSSFCLICRREWRKNLGSLETQGAEIKPVSLEMVRRYNERRVQVSGYI